MPSRRNDLIAAQKPAPVFNGEAADALLERLQPGRLRSRGELLPLLHAVQRELGYVPDAIVPAIAYRLNLSRADVHGVVTFYPDFRRAPAGTHLIKICRAEACKARGSDIVERQAAEHFATPIGSTRADGLVTLEPVYCP